MTGLDMFDLAPAMTEIFLVCVAMALLMLGAFRDEEQDTHRFVSSLAIMALVVGMFIVLMGDKETITTFGGLYVTDGFASYMKALVLLGVAVCLIMTPAFFQKEGVNRFEYTVLALFATVGMLMMISANSLISLYVALELQSLPLYVMTAFHRDRLRASEAGLKYFVLGALASGILLYGCSMVYGFTGTLSFPGLAQALSPETIGEGTIGIGVVVGLVFVAAGLAFKLAAVPFHMWTPDVYEGAPTPVTAFLAAAPKVAAMALTIRIFYQPFGEWASQWQQIVVFIAIASMLLGAFAAIGQTNLKRLLAYSGIGHIGFALVGLTAGTEQGVYSVLVYIAIYLIMTLGTFACVLALRRNDAPVETIDDLAGLARQQPLFAAAIAVFMFSLAGIPPLAGFFGKFYVFMAAVDAGLTPVAIIGVLASVVGAYYYLRIVKIMYFDETIDPIDRSIGSEYAIVLGVAAIFNIAFCLRPSFLLGHAERAALTLFS
ncbi:MAG: NADH-quinone oxidoreductase subunit NuoN [Geminicoccaceae bacterium]